MSEAVNLLLWQMRAAKVETPLVEHRFHAARRWRFDLAWPDRRLAAEVDGGSWTGGRHVTGTGFEADAQKMSAAAAEGWRVLRLTPSMIESGYALELIERALAYGIDQGYG